MFWITFDYFSEYPVTFLYVLTMFRVLLCVNNWSIRALTLMFFFDGQKVEEESKEDFQVWRTQQDPVVRFQ
jgi:hypothetical protein